MTDTFGRLVNAAYALGIDPRKASLFAVRDQCSASSSLGTVLRDVSHTEWLRKVRDLRGRCQHADIEEILSLRPGAFSHRGEPHVDPAYSWRPPAQQMSIVAYAQDAVQAADLCLDAAIEGILASPGSPISNRDLSVCTSLSDIPTCGQGLMELGCLLILAPIFLGLSPIKRTHLKRASSRSLVAEGLSSISSIKTWFY